MSEETSVPKESSVDDHDIVLIASTSTSIPSTASISISTQSEAISPHVASSSSTTQVFSNSNNDNEIHASGKRSSEHIHEEDAQRKKRTDRNIALTRSLQADDLPAQEENIEPRIKALTARAIALANITDQRAIDEARIIQQQLNLLRELQTSAQRQTPQITHTSDMESSPSSSSSSSQSPCRP